MFTSPVDSLAISDCWRLTPPAANARQHTLPPWPASRRGGLAEQPDAWHWQQRRDGGNALGGERSGTKSGEAQ
jgi:hypothetical protein